MAAVPRGRKTPEPDIETGMKMIKPASSTPIEVVVDRPIPEQPKKKELTGQEILAKAIGPGTYNLGGKKSRKQKKRVHKKTQKRRGRK